MHSARKHPKDSPPRPRRQVTERSGIDHSRMGADSAGYGGGAHGSAIVKLPWKSIGSEILYPAGADGSMPRVAKLQSYKELSRQHHQRAAARGKHGSQSAWDRMERVQRLVRTSEKYRPIMTPDAPTSMGDEAIITSGGRREEPRRRAAPLDLPQLRRMWTERGQYEHYQLSDLMEYIGEDSLLQRKEASVPPPPEHPTDDELYYLGEQRMLPDVPRDMSVHTEMQPATSGFTPRIDGRYRAEPETQTIVASNLVEEGRRRLLNVSPHYKYSTGAATTAAAVPIETQTEPEAPLPESIDPEDWASHYLSLRVQHLRLEEDTRLYM